MPAIPRASPYQGLIPFDEADAPFFFGRDQDIRLITANLFAAPLTLLYGASGVGKSSLLRAGVAQRLRARADLLLIVFNAWQGDPIQNLKDALADAARGAALSASPDASLGEFLAACATQTNRRLLIILDQFEEYFLYHQDDAFAAQFARAVTWPNLALHFLISIREDSLAKLDRFEGRIPTLFDNIYRLEHLNRQGATDAITQPLAAYNRLIAPPNEPIEIEPALVEQVIVSLRAGEFSLGDGGRGETKTRDAALEIETPFLQLVMTRLWDEEMRAGARRLRADTLQRLGGARRIAQTHLDEVMRALAPAEQETAARAFRYLVTRSGAKIAYSVPDLAAVSEIPESLLAPALEKLAAGIRILRALAPLPNQPGGARYEIFHDVLAPAILDWRARFLQAQDRAAAQHQIARERRRVFRLTLALASVTVLLVAFVALAYFAFTQQRLASSRELAANANAQLRVDPELSVLLAANAAQIAPTHQAEDALRQALLASNLRATLRGHTDQLTGAAFSPDGQLIVSASLDGTARVWDARAGKMIAELRGHTRAVIRASFSPDNQRVLTASADKSARVWDARAGKMLFELLGHPDIVTSAAFSPDGARILTASWDQTARVWDASTGKSLFELRGHSDAVNSASFSRDGKLILTASDDKTARVWDATTGKVMAEMRGHTSTVTSAAFSPDSRRVVTASGNIQQRDEIARVWDTSTGKLLVELRGHTDAISTASFSSDGTRVVTASADKTARVWDAASAKNIAEFREHSDRVNTVSFSADDRFVLTSSHDTTARVWEISTGKIVAEMRGHRDVVGSAQFDRENKFVVTASWDQTARVWELPAAKFVAELRGHADAINNLAFSPNGKWIATAGQDDHARVWDALSGKTISELRGHAGPVTNVSFSADSAFVATASLDGTARIWDAASGKPVAELRGHRGSVASAVFSPDDKYILTASIDQTARVWDRANSAVIAELRGDAAPVNRAAFSPDGARVVTASGNTAKIWDWRAGKIERELAGHSERVLDAAYSADGKWILTTSADKTARAWDANTGQFTLELRGHTDAVRAGRFSADGKFIITASRDSLIRVWDAATGARVLDLTGVAAVFAPQSKQLGIGREDGIAQIYACEVCGALDELAALARTRVTRELTCQEKQKYLDESVACAPAR